MAFSSLLLWLAYWVIPWTVLYFPELPYLLFGLIQSIFIDPHEKRPQRATDVPLPKEIAELSDAKNRIVPDDEKDASGKPLRKMKGWLEVRRQYASTKGILSFGQTSNFAGATPLASANHNGSDGNASNTGLPGASLADDSSVMEPVEGDEGVTAVPDDAASIMSKASSTATRSSTNTGSTSTTAPSRSIWQAARMAMLWKNNAATREKFYGVLKGSVLYLYEDDKQTDALYVLPIDRYHVKINTRSGEFGGKDGEMFNKKNAVILQLDRTTQEDTAGLSVVGKDTSVDEAARKREAEMEFEPWYIFSRNHSEMEDWYLAFARESLDKGDHQETFGREDMETLIKEINKEEDPVPMRWLTAMFGRVFFMLNRTAWLEDVIIGRIMKKLKKLPSSQFVKDVAVREFNLGTFPPIFSKPMLKDIRADGYTAFHTHLSYRARGNQANSAAHITFAAIVGGIPGLGERGTVNIIATAVVKHIEGDMIFQIKDAPSNRMWYGFTSAPHIDFDLILYPVGGEKRISSTWVLNKLKTYILTAISEAIVAPNFDDLALFDTTGLPIRGGVFDQSARSRAQKDRHEVQLTEPTDSSSGLPGVVPKADTDAPAKSKSFHSGGTGAVEGSGNGSGKESPPRKRSRSPKKQATTILASVPLPSWPAKQHTAASAASAPVGTDLHKSATESHLVSEPASLAPADDRHRGRQDVPVVDMQRDGSSGSAKTLPVQPRNGGGLKGGLPRPISTHTDSAPSSAGAAHTSPTGSLFSSFARPKSTDSSASAETAQLNRSLSPSGSARTSTPPAGEQPAPPQTHVPTASTIFGSLKARDKDALSGHVSNVRGALSSWSNKKKAEYQHYQASRAEAAAKLQGQPLSQPSASSPSGSATTQPMPMYRPASHDRDSHPGSLAPSSPPSAQRSALGHTPAKSLQERLTDVSRAAAAANQENRARSASNASSTTSASASRHALLASSPPKAGLVEAAPSTSEPDLVLSQHRTPPNGTTKKSSSPGPNPVLLQPAAGRSMVVPRVPKRPGQVTGLGSSPGQGVTRKLSDADADAEGDGTDSSPPSETATPPTLPPRHSEFPSVPLPPVRPTPSSSTPTSVPPPLPARTTPEPGPRLAPENEAHTADVPADTTSLPTSPPNGSTPGPEDQGDSKPDQIVADHDSDAQNALRRLAEQEVDVK